MRLFIKETFEDLSSQAAIDLIELMQAREDPLVCVASGDSPAGLYKNIAGKINKKELDISRWSFVGLDEWVGMNGTNEGSCRFHLNNQLFGPCHVKDTQIFFLDGSTEDLQKECAEAETFVKQQGGIDVAILGLGLNGHIGMNEPGTSLSSRTHVTTLDTLTQQTGQKYFKEQQQLNEGITLGLATLMEAKYVMLLVSGPHKAAIVKKVLEGEISEEVPASLLRGHPGLSVYLDAAAAELLQNDES
ncbi:MAG: glucosamine/galactosamine-6-phosphateisomerase [Ferruginibacter sp.]|nr:glucosamine/galactosamine-6-phosphateisomerase [Ferruginibacter sp.]